MFPGLWAHIHTDIFVCWSATSQAHSPEWCDMSHGWAHTFLLTAVRGEQFHDVMFSPARHTNAHKKTSQDAARRNIRSSRTYTWEMHFMAWHFIYIVVCINYFCVYALMDEWQCFSRVCVWESCTFKSVKEGYADRLPAYHTPIHLHKSILSERHRKPVIPSSPCFSSSPHSPPPPPSSCLSLHEANPIHCNIIQASPRYLDSLPEPKRHTQGQIDFPVALDLWQSGRNHIAQPPTSPPHPSFSISNMHSKTHTHLPPLNVSQANESILRIFCFPRETSGTANGAFVPHLDGWSAKMRKNVKYTIRYEELRSEQNIPE